MVKAKTPTRRRSTKTKGAVEKAVVVEKTAKATLEPDGEKPAMVKAKAPARRPSTKTKDAAEKAVVVEKTAKAVSEPDGEKSRFTFTPLVLGGVLSGAVGFGAATLYFMNRPSDEAQAQALVQVQATLGEHDEKFDEADAMFGKLSGALEGVETSFNGKLSGLAEATAQKDTGMVEALSTLSDSIAAFEARLSALENRPVAETGEAPAVYERELLAMRHLLEAQRIDIEKLTEATARMEDTRQQAATLEENAVATARATALRAAVSQLQSALDSGSPFKATLADLTVVGVEVPQALADAAEGGVSTLAALQDSFPEAARAGLGASVKAMTGDGAMGKLGSFFRSQVGARSLEPREGDDPDAVLSRAEAALGNGDINTALALIGTLPKEGQAAMSGWVAAAGVRIKAVDAVRTLANGLNGN